MYKAAFRAKYLLDIVDEGKTVYTHILNSVIRDVKEFLNIEYQDMPIEQVLATLKKEAEFCSKTSEIYAAPYEALVRFLEYVVKAGSFEWSEVQRVLDKHSRENKFFKMAQKIDELHGAVHVDERAILAELAQLVYDITGDDVCEQSVDQTIKYLDENEYFINSYITDTIKNELLKLKN